MPHVKKLTPNLIVSDVERSVAFYRDILGFTQAMTVPDAPPLAFATLTLFMEVEHIEAVHDALAGRVTIVMPLEKKWYGVTEFAITDPDGYVITFAERVAE